MRYTVILEKGEDGYIVANVPALPGCITQGKTREEALKNAKEAIELTFPKIPLFLVQR